ncbi:MAG TPA: PspC domain-containing protein [Thermococcus sp.]|nr:PspC domain-containing protein [Thermococcus sp.]
MRSRRNRVFLGVIGGMAEYLDVDPVLLRIIFVVLLVVNPPTMILLYFLLALIMPDEEGEEKPLGERLSELAEESGKKTNEILSDNNTKTLAIILIVLGAVLVAKPFFPLIVGPVGGTTLLAVVLLVIGIILFLEGD